MKTPHMTDETSQTGRLDKWLWYARFFKTRTLATQTIKAKKIRLNNLLVGKASVLVKPGDVLTFSIGNAVKIVEIKAMAMRRGPAPEARELYNDLSPEPPRHDPWDPRTIKLPARDPGAGRPTKADRRAIDKLHKIT